MADLLQNTNNSTVITNWIIAVSTFVYTIGTFLLWWITYRSVQITKDEVKRKEDLLNMNHISNVYKDFREIYMLILNDKDNVKVLANELSLSVGDLKKEYIAIFLINHVFEIYSLYERNLLPDKFWERTIIDMKVLFKWSFIKLRWQKMRTLFSTDFANFIDDEILKPDIF
jgi:hypothetical protein